MSMIYFNRVDVSEDAGVNETNASKEFIIIFLFYLEFLSKTLNINGAWWKKRGYLLKYPLPLPPTSQTLRY